MLYYKNNRILSGGTKEVCCRTCCEMDAVKRGNGGYCVHEGAVKKDDICPLYMKGDWIHRIELRKRRESLIHQAVITMQGLATREEVKNRVQELLSKGNDLETVSKIIFANIDYSA